MTPTQFLAAIKALGFPSPYAAAGAIGVNPATAWRYSIAEKDGGTPVPKPVQLLLRMYLRYGLLEDA